MSLCALHHLWFDCMLRVARCACEHCALRVYERTFLFCVCLYLSSQELLRFSLTDWEALIDDAGLYDVVERDKVKLVFLQVHAL